MLCHYSVMMVNIINGSINQFKNTLLLNLYIEMLKKIKIRYFQQCMKVNAARKSKVDDNTAKMQSIKQLGV